MTLRSVMIQLEIGQIEQLDKEATRSGMSRSQLVRDAVEAFLRPPVDATLEQRYAEAYAQPALGRDEWGDIDDWHAAASAERSKSERDPW